jgi:UDPglucose 6-dehydrogenase
MESLWKRGARLQTFDPEAMDEARRLYGERPDLLLCESPESALQGADALVVLTEWNVFRSPDFGVMKAALKQPVIFDGRNLYDPKMLAGEGFTYYAIARPATP